MSKNETECCKPDNRFKHRYSGKQDKDGYALCDKCGCAENSRLAACYCAAWLGHQVYAVLHDGTHCDKDMAGAEYLRKFTDYKTRLKKEKERRIYYQDIVYHVCNKLDWTKDRKPGMGIVCGTVDEPSHEVQDEMDELVAHLASLEAENKRLRDALGQTSRAAMGIMADDAVNVKEKDKHIAELEAQLAQKDAEIARLKDKIESIEDEPACCNCHIIYQERIEELSKALEGILWDYDNNCDIRFLDESLNKARKMVLTEGSDE